MAQMKISGKQSVTPRQPRQARSRYKVQLILEATIRLLEKQGLEAVTTNAIAAAAGVSIGTLYQFFPNKEAILDALADREMTELSARVVQVMESADVTSSEERVAAVVRAVAESYGGRDEAHRLVMIHSLSRGGKRLSSLLAKLTGYLASDREVGPIRRALTKADAFVLAHAFTGVLRGMISQREAAPSKGMITRSLARLVSGFIR